jgi:hypothetical protein
MGKLPEVQYSTGSTNYVGKWTFGSNGRYSAGGSCPAGVGYSEDYTGSSDLRGGDGAAAAGSYKCFCPVHSCGTPR